MREAIEEVLGLQTEYSSKVTDAMKRRGDIVKVELPNELRELLPDLEKRVGVDAGPVFASRGFCGAGC